MMRGIRGDYALEIAIIGAIMRNIRGGNYVWTNSSIHKFVHKTKVNRDKELVVGMPSAKVLH